MLQKLSFLIFLHLFSQLGFSSQTHTRRFPDRSSDDAFLNLLKKSPLSEKFFRTVWRGKESFQHLRAFLSNKGKKKELSLDEYFTEFEDFEEAILEVPSFSFKIKISDLGLLKTSFFCPKNIRNKFDCGRFCSVYLGRSHQDKKLFPFLLSEKVKRFTDRNKLTPGNIVVFNKNLFKRTGEPYYAGIHFALYLGRGLYLSKFGYRGSILVTDFQTLKDFYEADFYDLCRVKEQETLDFEEGEL